MADSEKKKVDDPTKDPDFMRVVKHFLKTPHKPHETMKDQERRAPPRRKRAPLSDKDGKNRSDAK